MKWSRVRTTAIAVLIAAISKVTGDMLLSQFPQGKAFGATPARLGPPSPTDNFDGAAVLANNIARATHPARWADARNPSTSADGAILQAPLSAAPLGSISLVGSQPIDSDLVNSDPRIGPTVGPGAGPFASGLPRGAPPNGGINPVGSNGGGLPPSIPPPLAPAPAVSPPPVLPPPPVLGVPEPSDWSMILFGFLALGPPLRLSKTRKPAAEKSAEIGPAPCR
jgi:hypothetical protein